MATVSRNRKHQKVTPFAKAALRGCDWLVNSQTRQQKPQWDANHGRVPYHIHVPSGTVVQGLNWSMARATYCLVTAYQYSGDACYLESAKLAMGYAMTLQVMDVKDSNYGAFHEETPHSPFCYPRDGIETAGGFLVLYSATREKEYLRRAELYLDWYFRRAYVKAGRWGYWTKPEIRFDGAKPQLTAFGAYQAGAGYILHYAYVLTKKVKYKKYCIQYAENALKMYYRGSVSNWIDKAKSAKDLLGIDHMGINDDGMGVSILAAYQLTKDQKYLKACQDVCDYFARLEFDRSNHAGVCSVTNFLIETEKAGGTKRYQKAIQILLKEVLAKQLRHKDELLAGGFLGEDENTEWYYPNSKPTDYVVTRTTAYAILSLFKADGLVWGKGYSVRLG